MEQLAALPEENQLQPQLTAEQIAQEVRALGGAASPTAHAAAAETPSDLSELNLSNRPVFFQHADTVHITIMLPPGYGSSQAPQE